ncbi:uncharacterized protein LOC143035633 [Oratosquilla oratoria]|uniref:uncharacterized protein LOC143035633 n=1 Tax=Oratosquilla oratoria TaxID=337810 RepID=UPI003F771ED2
MPYVLITTAVPIIKEDCPGQRLRDLPEEKEETLTLSRREPKRSIDFKDKILANFDVQSLFTNVLIQNAISAIKKVLPHINRDDLPNNKKDYLKLIEMCFKCASVSFDGKTFHQHEGLPMGSPLNTNISDILSRLNQVHPKIQLTVEHEVNGSLPFLDTVTIKENNSVRFKVYRKPTHKDDYIHYSSAHDKKTKTGVVMGFYLRALRICSPEFLNEELQHITKTFVKPSFPAGPQH